MTYQQVREILKRIRRVHEEAAAHCAQTGDTDDERLRLLAEFMRSGEERLGKQIAAVEEGAQAEVLETWVQFVPTGDVEKALRALRESDAEGADATFGSCLQLQAQIVAAFRHLAEILPSPEAQETLRHMADMEERAIHEWGLADTTREDG